MFSMSDMTVKYIFSSNKEKVDKHRLVDTYARYTY